MIKKKSHTKQKKSTRPPEELEIIQSVVLALTGEAASFPPSEKVKGKKLKPSEKPHYVNSKQFEDEIRLFYKTNVITNYLADSIRRIAYGLSFAPNFINYSYKDEMIGDAVVKMYQALKYKKFILDKGFSPFSYFTTIAFHAFVSRIKKEKKYHQLITDFRERNYSELVNQNEDETGIRVYTEPEALDNSQYNQSNS